MTLDSASSALSYAFPRRSMLRRIAVLTSLMLVLCAVVAALFLVRSIDGQLEDIEGTYEVRRQARDLMIALVDAETGQRGYIISRDPQYLAPYNAAVSRLGSTFETLTGLVADDPEQRERLESLVPDLDAKRAEMVGTIELVSQGRSMDAISLVRTDTGLEVMDRIRGALNTFIAVEEGNLVRRNGEIGFQRHLLFATVLVALGSAAILAIGLLTRSQRRLSALSQESVNLRSQNEELEVHIRARTREAEEARAHAERERARLETLLQDTNHRIGNSLATVSSLLGLQLARSGSDEVRHALEAAQARVQAIASSHRRLRLGDDLETTDAAEFLGDVIADLASTLPADKNITFHPQIEPMVLPARDATTIGIVVSELITNALKHAFQGRQSGLIVVRFARVEDVPVLTVEDDGVGMDEEQTQSGLGALIIKQLSRQFGGDEPIHEARAGGGTSVSVRLPKL